MYTRHVVSTRKKYPPASKLQSFLDFEAVLTCWDWMVWAAMIVQITSYLWKLPYYSTINFFLTATVRLVCGIFQENYPSWVGQRRSTNTWRRGASWDPMAPWKVPAIKFDHTLVGSFIRGYNWDMSKKLETNCILALGGRNFIGINNNQPTVGVLGWVMGMGDKACWSWLTDGAPPSNWHRREDFFFKN